MEKIIRLTKDQVKPAAKTATRAFLDYPLWDSLFSDASVKYKFHLNTFEFTIKHSILSGEAYATPNLEGVALWAKPGKIYMNLVDMIRAGGLKVSYKIGSTVLFDIGLKKIISYMKSMEYIEKAHKRLVPFQHWYLAVLAVDPDHQGRGHAGDLLRPMLARIDREGLPLFLETQKERNVALYERFGFEVLEKAPIPGLDITTWAMLRKIK